MWFLPDKVRKFILINHEEWQPADLAKYFGVRYQTAKNWREKLREDSEAEITLLKATKERLEKSDFAKKSGRLVFIPVYIASQVNDTARGSTSVISGVRQPEWVSPPTFKTPTPPTENGPPSRLRVETLRSPEDPCLSLGPDAYADDTYEFPPLPRPSDYQLSHSY